MVKNNWKILAVTLVLVAVILIPHSFGHSRDVVEVPASINPVKIDGVLDSGEWSDTITISLKDNRREDGKIRLKYEVANQILAGYITMSDPVPNEQIWIYFDTGHKGNELDETHIFFIFDYKTGEHGVGKGTGPGSLTWSFTSLSISSPFSSFSSDIRPRAGGWHIEFKIGFISNPKTMGFLVEHLDEEYGKTLNSYPGGCSRSCRSDPSTWADITFPVQGGAITVTTTSTKTVTTTSRTTITATTTATLTRTMTSTSATTLTRTMTSTSATTITNKLSAQTVTKTSIPPAKTTTVTSEVIEQVFSTRTRTVTSELYRNNDINNDTAFIDSEMALALAGIMIIVSLIAGLIIKRGK